MKLIKSSAKFNNPFVMMKNKNFRYLWIAMLLTLTGTWMQNMTQIWFAYKLTNSAFLLGLIGVLQFTPVLVLSLFAGVIIDRFSKKIILILTQAMFIFLSVILTVLTFAGMTKYWHIASVALLSGIVNTLDVPTRHSFIPELVTNEEIRPAMALGSSAFNIARVVGPAIAGLLMGYLGMAWCFLATLLSFIGGELILMFIQMSQNIKKGSMSKDGIVSEIKCGLKYVHKCKDIFYSILSLAAVSTFALNSNVLIPVFTRLVLNRQEAGFGILMAFMGVGCLAGAIFVASKGKKAPSSFILELLPFIIALLLVITGFTRLYITTSILVTITGFGITAFSATINSIIQSYAQEEYRGRVTALYILVFNGAVAIGNGFSGTVLSKKGPRVGYISCGLALAGAFGLVKIYKSLSNKFYQRKLNKLS